MTYDGDYRKCPHLPGRRASSRPLSEAPDQADPRRGAVRAVGPGCRTPSRSTRAAEAKFDGKRGAPAGLDCAADRPVASHRRDPVASEAPRSGRAGLAKGSAPRRARKRTATAAPSPQQAGAAPARRAAAHPLPPPAARDCDHAAHCRRAAQGHTEVAEELADAAMEALAAYIPRRTASHR